MTVQSTSIEGLYVVTWPLVVDARGFFRQTYQHGELSAAIGRELRMRQGNHSRSAANVLRGFHTEPWDKLIYVVRGLATCVIADVRPDSPTFCQTESFLLGDEPGQRMRLFVSRGLSNAFYCHAETDYLNDVSEEFDPSNRHGVAWNDPMSGVQWHTDAPTVSEADRNQPFMKDLFPNHPKWQRPLG